MKFISKAETLDRLKIKNAVIPKLIIFKFEYFEKNIHQVLKKIKLNFYNKSIIIRSSFSNEDTGQSSQAGKFKSFLNISPTDEVKIINSIRDIRKSQKKIKKNDIFFIQEMVQDVKISGVVLTKSLVNYSRCLNINYSLGKDTSLVTSGSGDTESLVYFTNQKYKIPKNSSN